jgi:phosphoribosyl 1,2-cyclic phosphodiesterase
VAKPFIVSQLCIQGRHECRALRYLSASAIEILPRYGVRELDGVIITHGHADACFGMDDLRGWTLGGIIQSHIDVYLAPETMEVISRTFPFLVDSALATGMKRVKMYIHKALTI